MNYITTSTNEIIRKFCKSFLSRFLCCNCNSSLIAVWHCNLSTFWQGWICVASWKQGPQNLYGRDGKFCATFENGMEKCGFSVPLLMPRCHQIDLPKSKLNPGVALVAKNAPNCTDLHLYFHKFLGVTRSPDHSPSARIHRPTFSELLRPLVERLTPIQNGWTQDEVKNIGVSDIWWMHSYHVVVCMTVTGYIFLHKTKMDGLVA